LKRRNKPKETRNNSLSTNLSKNSSLRRPRKNSLRNSKTSRMRTRCTLHYRNKCRSKSSRTPTPSSRKKSYELEKAQKLKLEAENLDDSDSRKKNFLARALEKLTEIKKSLFEAQQSANEAKKQLDATIKAQAK